MPEVTRALRALSSAYVERRQKVERGATLDSAGKRAAFALFYAPLHFLTTTMVVRAVGAESIGLNTIVDLGCGTGSAGAAWALASGAGSVLGIDRHPWAVEEARWTYRQLHLIGHARQGDAARLPPLRPGTGVIAAYLLNELPDAARQRLVEQLAAARLRGIRSLVLEPIARAITPWWDETAAAVIAAGGRADEWKFTAELPELLTRFDRSAGLNHRELKVRSLFL